MHPRPSDETTSPSLPRFRCSIDLSFRRRPCRPSLHRAAGVSIHPHREPVETSGKTLGKGLGAVLELADPCHARAVGATVEVAVRLHTVAYDLDVAVLAGRGQGVD